MPPVGFLPSAANQHDSLASVWWMKSIYGKILFCFAFKPSLKHQLNSSIVSALSCTVIDIVLVFLLSHRFLVLARCFLIFLSRSWICVLIVWCSNLLDFIIITHTIWPFDITVFRKTFLAYWKYLRKVLASNISPSLFLVFKPICVILVFIFFALVC